MLCPEWTWVVPSFIFWVSKPSFFIIVVFQCRCSRLPKQLSMQWSSAVQMDSGSCRLLQQPSITSCKMGHKLHRNKTVMFCFCNVQSSDAPLQPPKHIYFTCRIHEGLQGCKPFAPTLPSTSKCIASTWPGLSIQAGLSGTMSYGLGYHIVSKM